VEAILVVYVVVGPWANGEHAERHDVAISIGQTLDR